MRSYFLRRLLLIIPTFIGATLIVFSMTRFVPGGPVERIIMESSAMAMDGASGNRQSMMLSERQIEKLKEFYGLDKPIPEAYVDWIGNVLTGELGKSTRYYMPVWDMIIERLPIALYFGVLTFIISTVVSIPLGVAKALKHGGLMDNVSSGLIFLGFAVPAYVVGVLLLTWFSFSWELFPMGGFVHEDFEDFSRGKQFLDLLWHTALPLICYLIADFAVLTVTMKNNLMENLSADYVRTAVAKGMPFKQAVKNHAFRNSLIPLASHFGNFLTAFLGGSFLIEVIFNIDGIGLLGFEALVENDYPVVMGLLAITTGLFLVGNILSDILVALVDPRVKYGAK
ncbi:ABC transporter permease subunit [Reinekea marina]|uniref:ABC transporter permease subunit n=2 Tax=Reinekea marina TaxID=1310421 RepID=UPI0020908ECD